MELQAVVAVFVAETLEGLAVLETAMIALERQPDDSEALRQAFRVAHTLKGDAHSLGFSHVGEFAHAMEDVLDGLRRRRIELSKDAVDMMLACVDALRSMVSDAAAGSTELKPEERILLARLRGDTAGKSQPGLSGTADKVAGGTLRIDLARLDKMLNLIGEIAIARGRLQDALSNQAENS